MTDTTVINTTAEDLFSLLPLREELLKSLNSLNYSFMTPIQKSSLPLMLDRKDVIAQAKTGSGKTAAFGLALLQQLKVEFFGAQGLILSPTRELAEQISQALRRLACFMPNVKVINLSGGIPMKPQLDSLRHGAHIIVGTPGRILKHLNKGSLNISQIRTLVLDEADRMLDMGFLDDIKTVISACPKQRQTLLFSATYPEEIKLISQQVMNQPESITIEQTDEPLDIDQVFYEVPKQSAKFPAVKSLLLHYNPTATLIFCNTKQQVADLTHFLTQEGFSASPLHGDMAQIDRDLAMIQFVNRSCSILVATDVAARGLDIKELPAVINFDLAFDHDVHIHRIGRTGRAGSKGLAMSLSTPADAMRLSPIEAQLKQQMSWKSVHDLMQLATKPMPPEMMTLRINAGKKDKIRAGDILGALTKEAGILGGSVGTIHINPLCSFVAIERAVAKKVYEYFQNGALKGRRVSATLLKVGSF